MPPSLTTTFGQLANALIERFHSVEQIRVAAAQPEMMVRVDDRLGWRRGEPGIVGRIDSAELPGLAGRCGCGCRRYRGRASLLYRRRTLRRLGGADQRAHRPGEP